MPKEIAKGYTPPSEQRQLNRVFRKDELVTESFRENLCGLTAPNMVGALVFASHCETFRTLYQQSPLQLPRFVDSPLTVVADLPLALKSTYGDVEVGGITAEKVLIKKVCGQTSGVVIQGEMSGLVLEEIEGIPPTEALCINQVWQDIPIQQEWPELPHFTIATINDDDTITDPKAVLAAKKKMEDTFNALFTQTLADLGYALPSSADQSSQPIYPSDIFFKLCTRMSIPVDTERFLRMRE